MLDDSLRDCQYSRGKGAGIAAGAGGALGLATVLLSRGQDVRMEAGTTVEMELQRPLILEEARVTQTNRPHPRQLLTAFGYPMNPREPQALEWIFRRFRSRGEIGSCRIHIHAPDPSLS